MQPELITLTLFQQWGDLWGYRESTRDLMPYAEPQGAGEDKELHDDYRGYVEQRIHYRQYKFVCRPVAYH